MDGTATCMFGCPTLFMSAGLVRHLMLAKTQQKEMTSLRSDFIASIAVDAKDISYVASLLSRVHPASQKLVMP